MKYAIQLGILAGHILTHELDWICKTRICKRWICKIWKTSTLLNFSFLRLCARIFACLLAAQCSLFLLHICVHGKSSVQIWTVTEINLVNVCLPAFLASFYDELKHFKDMALQSNPYPIQSIFYNTPSNWTYHENCLISSEVSKLKSFLRLFMIWLWFANWRSVLATQRRRNWKQAAVSESPGPGWILFRQRPW